MYIGETERCIHGQIKKTEETQMSFTKLDLSRFQAKKTIVSALPYASLADHGPQNVSGQLLFMDVFVDCLN